MSGVTICGVQFQHPIMNAAGLVKTAEHLDEVIRSSSSAALLGSLTGQERPGNEEPRYFFNTDRQYSINAMGLPDPGPRYYGEGSTSAWGDLFTVAIDSDKPVILSIAPLGDFESSLDELLGWAHAWGVDGIELNLGCPNVWGPDGAQKRIASFDLNGIAMQVEGLSSIWSGPIWFKLSPYSDPVQLQETASYFIGLPNELRERTAIVTSNTFPNGMVMNDRGKPLLSVRFGGVAGPALKPIALGQVAQWSDALADTGIPIIGVGGVRSGIDVADYLAAGACAVQVATHFYQNGARVFHEIVQEWLELA